MVHEQKWVQQIDYENFDAFFQDYFRPPVINGASHPYHGCVFRGMSKAEAYQLIPTALRKEKNGLPAIIRHSDAPTSQGNVSANTVIEAEFESLFRFYQDCNMQGLSVPGSSLFSESYLSMFHETTFGQIDKWYSSDVKELAALAQHHGYPTRLLDWTFDIFVAFYFAVQGVVNAYARKKQKGSNCDIEERYAIWAVDARWLTTVDDLGKQGEQCPIRFFVPNYASNSNLKAQSGLLSYHEVSYQHEGYLSDYTEETQDDVICRYLDEFHEKRRNIENQKFIHKLTFPTSEAILVFEFLRNHGYHAAKLFPGYDGIVRKITEDNWIRDFRNWGLS